MKKLALVFMVLFVVSLMATGAHAQSWVTANQVTLEWNAVPKPAPTDIMKYQVYTKFGSTTATPQPVVGEIEALAQTVTFQTEGRYYLCVGALRYPEGETTPIPSERIACSDIAADTQAGVPFGVKFFVSPAVPGGLRTAQ